MRLLRRRQRLLGAADNHDQCHVVSVRGSDRHPHVVLRLHPFADAGTDLGPDTRADANTDAVANRGPDVDGSCNADSHASADALAYESAYGDTDRWSRLVGLLCAVE